jgi:transposase
MSFLVKAYVDLQTNYELCTSIVGIGFATTVHFIISTENFTRFDDARKLVCYCGVAPFKHESDSSIRGKTMVSHLANKKLKQGKAKMSVLNIIRAKLIYRIFTVVKRQTKYEVHLAA